MPARSVTIASDALTAEIAMHGAELQRLTDRAGRELLWDGDPDVWRGRAPILFPVIGMLVDGRYRLGGTEYPMPKHGFARGSMFDVIENAADAVTLRLNDSKATRAFYPFGFTLDIAFRLAGAALTVTAAIANTGDAPMPASFGFHPASAGRCPSAMRAASTACGSATPNPRPFAGSTCRAC